MPSHLLQVSRWDACFENDRSRQRDRCAWVPIPNAHDGRGLQRLLALPDGLAVFGVWNLLVQALSRQRRPRAGWLTDNGAADGEPWSAEDLAWRWHRKADEVARAFQVLADVGWLVDYGERARRPAAPAAATADAPPTHRPHTADPPPAHRAATADLPPVAKADGSPHHAHTADAPHTHLEGKGREGREPPPPRQDEPDEPEATVATIPATATTARFPRVELLNRGEAAAAIGRADLLRLVAAFGANVGGDRAGEWRRDAAGLTLPTVAAILNRAAEDGAPIREPSGFRTARVAWKALDPLARWEWADVFCQRLGIASPAQPATVAPESAPPA